MRCSNASTKSTLDSPKQSSRNLNPERMFNMDPGYPHTHAYAPMPLYIIPAIGVAIFSLLASKRPSLLRTAPPFVSFLLLYVTWLPLVLYNLAFLIIGMIFGPIEVSYQDLSKSLGLIFMQLAHFLHLLITLLFFPCLLSSLKYEG